MIQAFFAREQTKEYEPTAVYIAIYNFFELNASEYFEAVGLPVNPAPDRVVVGLPYVDHTNPLLWCALAHEMGHAFEKKRRVAENVVTLRLDPTALAILTAWAKELVSDQVGLRLLGPAYLNAFLALMFTGHPTGFTPSDSHPQPHTRLKLMLDHLERLGVASDSARGYMRVFDDLVREFGVTENLGEHRDRIACNSCSQPLEIHIPAPAMPLGDLWQRIADHLERDPEFQRLTRFEPVHGQDVALLVDLLRKGQPISAYRRGNEPQILEDVRRLLGDPEALKRVTRDQAYTLLGRIEETPSTVAQILNAGWEYRWQSHVDTFKHHFIGLTDDIEKRSDAYVDHLGRLDYLLQKSIESSQLHTILKG